MSNRNRFRVVLPHRRVACGAVHALIAAAFIGVALPAAAQPSQPSGAQPSGAQASGAQQPAAQSSRDAAASSDATAPAKLTLEQANTIATKALERARELGFSPLTVVVLDDAGHLKAAQRDDGASMFRFDVAMGKAWASVAMGASSSVLAERARDNPIFFTTLAATAEGRFLPQPGGVLIRNARGDILGAAGASGAAGTEDEAAVAWGIEQAGLVPDLPSRSAR